MALFSAASTLTACLRIPPHLSGPRHPQASRIGAAEGHRIQAGVPGLSVAWIENGRPVGDHALGLKNVETAQPVTRETLFEAASLSKPVAAYVALILAERGELDLDAPLVGYAPADPPVADDRRLAAITARHVLTHSSGLPNWRPGRWSDAAEPLAPSFEPGTRYAYSGEGFMWLQRALEAISGLPLEALAEREVLGPLGMTSSDYVWRDAYRERVAMPHDADGKVGDKRGSTEAGAAFSLHTTAADYARFVAEVLRPTLLPAAAVDAMLRPWRVTPVSWGAEEEADPTGLHVAWGLGWGLEQNGDETLSFWHWGDNGDFKAFVMASPKTGDGFVVFTNSHRGLTLAEPLAEDVLPGPHPAFSWLGVTR